MSDAKIISLSDLPVAIPASQTDTFAVWQNPNGCGPEDTLVQMSLAQLADFVIAAVPKYTYVSQVVLSAQQVPLTNNEVIQLAEINLTPGEWLLWGEAWFALLSGNAANVNRVAAVLTPQPLGVPSEPADDTSATATAPANAGVGVVLPLSTLYVSTDVAITYYL